MTRRERLLLSTCTLRTASEWLELDLPTVRRLIDAGALGAVRVGNHDRVIWRDCVQVLSVIVAKLQKEIRPVRGSSRPAIHVLRGGTPCEGADVDGIATTTRPLSAPVFFQQQTPHAR